MTSVSYHLRLEFSYLMDAFAMPPVHPDEHQLDLDDSPTSVDTPPATQDAIERRDGSDERPYVYVQSQIDGMNAEQESGACDGYAAVKQATNDDNVTSSPHDKQHSSTLFEINEEPSEQSTTLSDAYYCERSRGHDLSVFDVVQDLDTSTSTLTILQDDDTVADTSVSSDKTEPRQRVPELRIDDVSAGTSQTISTGASASAHGETDSVPPQRLGVAKHRRSLSNTSAERASVEVVDFSDPLHDYQRSQDDSIFTAAPLALTEQKRTSSQRFRKLLGDVLLSMSPYLRHDAPYLETPPGLLCALRQYLPPNVFHSALFDDQVVTHAHRNRESSSADDIEASRDQSITSKMHAFLITQLKMPFTTSSFQVSFCYGTSTSTCNSLCTNELCVQGYRKLLENSLDQYF